MIICGQSRLEIKDKRKKCPFWKRVRRNLLFVKQQTFHSEFSTLVHETNFAAGQSLNRSRNNAGLKWAGEDVKIVEFTINLIGP